jgi:hypothetical protein
VLPNHIADDIWQRTCRRRLGGIDFGYTRPGASVWGGWCEDGGTFVVIGEWYKPRKQIHEQGYETLQAAPPNTLFFADSAEPRSIDLMNYGFEYKGARYALPVRAADKKAGSVRASTDAIRNLLFRRSGLEHPNYEVYDRGNKIGAPRLYIAERCKELIRELEELRDGNDPEADKQLEPPKEDLTIGDDHAIAGLRYVIYTSSLYGAQTTQHVKELD